MKFEISKKQYEYMRKKGFDMSGYVSEGNGPEDCPVCTCRNCETCRKKEE